MQHPRILWALNPVYGIALLSAIPGPASSLLGAVFLAVTGAEALYADMGHFGRTPLRRAWLWLVFPALLLNYFGQGALLLARSRRRSRTRSIAWRPTGPLSRWWCSPRSPRSSPRRR